MLAYYSALLKREDILRRIGDDTEEVATLANDLVCDLKVVAASCKNKNIEDALGAIKEAQDLIGIVNAMTNNIRENLDGYARALVSSNDLVVPNKDLDQIQEEQPKIKQEVQTVQELEQRPSITDPSQITGILEAIKSLRDMKDTLAK